MPRRSWLVCALTLALLASLARSAAADGERTFRLAFAAPEGCPSAADVSSRILSISARARVADPIEPAIELGARITGANSGFLGVLRVRLSDGTETTRTVPAATCAEAVSAMALIAAIVIDPDAALMSPPATAAVETTAGPAPEPSSVPPAETPKAPSSVDTPPLLDAPAPAAKHAPPPRFWFVASGEGGVEGAIAPKLTPDFALGLGWMDTKPSLLAPSLRLSARFATSKDVSLDDGSTANFERIAGRLTGCPLRVGLVPFALRPCAFVELGTLQGNGSNTVAPSHPVAFWAALGLTGRAEALLLGRLVLGVELGALAPLRRDRFYFDPRNQTAHRVDPLGFVGAIEVGVRFL